MTGIYKITSPNGRIYIGQSVDIIIRFKYYRLLKCEKQVRLYASFVKHGVENHIFEIVEECVIVKLNERERYWQDFYDATGKCGLNCKLSGYWNVKGSHSEETKNKIREKAKGHNRNLGRRHSEKSRQLMSKAQKGIKCSDVAKEKIRKKLTGSKLSEAHKENIKNNNGRRRIVLNLETGVFFDSVKEVSESYMIKQNTLITKLSGHRKNNTQFIYV